MMSDARSKTTALQMALVIAVIGGGISLRTPIMVSEAMQWSWITVILGAGLFILSMYLVIRLMSFFPGRSLAAFLPTLVGKAGTHLFIWFWTLTLFVHTCIRTQAFAREITYFLFDRTPLEAVILAFLLSAAYGAVQAWGTIVRVAHLIFFIVVPFTWLFVLFATINFEFIYFFPILPEDMGIVLKPIPQTWGVFSGYELLLVLFPLVSGSTATLIRCMTGAYVLRMCLALFSLLASIGSLSAATVKNAPFPTLLAVRLAELPGTFVERLDNFLLLSWIPIACLTVTVYLFCIGKMLTELYRLSDHRPLVLAQIPLFFFGAMSLHDIRMYQIAKEVDVGLGLFLSLGFIPLLLILSWLKNRRSHETTGKEM